MLGYDVEFGHKQAADLIPATKCAPTARAPVLRPVCSQAAQARPACRYAEKQVGYMACAILLNEVRLLQLLCADCGPLHVSCRPVVQIDEFLRLIINSIRNDLISRNEAFQCLALGFIGNGRAS